MASHICILVSDTTTLDGLERPLYKLCVFRASSQKYDRRQTHTISGEELRDCSFRQCMVYADIRWSTLAPTVLLVLSRTVWWWYECSMANSLSYQRVTIDLSIVSCRHVIKLLLPAEATAVLFLPSSLSFYSASACSSNAACYADRCPVLATAKVSVCLSVCLSHPDTASKQSHKPLRLTL